MAKNIKWQACRSDFSPSNRIKTTTLAKSIKSFTTFGWIFEWFEGRGI